MVIFGAKGHALELLQCVNHKEYSAISFYDNVNQDLVSVLNKFRVYKNDLELQVHFLQDARYALGIGGCALRRSIANKFDSLGGNHTTIVASTAIISPYATLCKGLTVMHNCFVAPNVVLEEGVLLNNGVSVHHDVTIGAYCEISPGARLLGRCSVGANTWIGASATILPDVIIGENAIIGAGAVVTKNVASNTKVVGVPARVTV